MKTYYIKFSPVVSPHNFLYDIGMNPGEYRLWYTSFLFSMTIFSFAFLYAFLYDGMLDLAMINKAVAATGGILIGLSFVLGPLCYYFNMFDTSIGYRKYFGVIGYFFALAYSLLLLVVYPETYFYGLPKNILNAEVLLGLSAMTILTIMYFVSNKNMMMKIGVPTWRTILRFGYLAYFLLIIRAFLVDGAEWAHWFATFDTIPPIRILLVTYASTVILLRLSIPVHKAMHPKPVDVTKVKIETNPQVIPPPAAK